VIAAGPGARKESGERIAMDVKVGDVVLYAKYSGTNIKLQGKEFLILKETDVLAIVLNGQA
jgi:chaperonin GroES